MRALTDTTIDTHRPQAGALGEFRDRLVDLHSQLALEAQLFRECAGTADFVEGLASFMGKREPRFQGR